MTTALARRQVVLERRQQEAVATARALCHTSQVLVARQRVASRLHLVVRAVWADGRLTCDRPLRTRARLLVDLGAEFSSDDPPRRFVASLQAPPVAVLLTLIRACDLATVIEVDLGEGHTGAS